MECIVKKQFVVRGGKRETRLAEEAFRVA